MHAKTSKQALMRKTIVNVLFCEACHAGQHNNPRIIPENVTEISSSVFSNRGNLVNVTLPSSLTEIGEYAFYCSQPIHNNDNITPKNAARNELRHATCIAPLYFFVRKKQKRNK